MILVKFGPLGMLWGPSYDVFVFYVGPHCPNTGYFDVYGGIKEYIMLFGGV